MTSSVLEITPQERKIAERVNPDVTKALAISQTAGGVMFANVEQVTEFAKCLAISKGGVRKHLRGDVGACLAIVVQSIEWGMSPFAVANKSYFVNDQIAFESQLIQAVILKRAPIKGRIRFSFKGQGDQRVCTASATLADGTGEVEYVSPPFGKILPKNSPLWKNDPDQQHCYYSGRALCRRHFPDVLLGVYAEDEFIGSQPMHVEPEHAKDVTPRTMVQRLDALSGETETAPAAAVEVEDAADEDDVDDTDAPSTQADPEDPVHAALMDSLRRKAERGTNALRLGIKGLKDSDSALLTDEDHDLLGGIAEKADAEAGAS